ncbi:hypothetical protein BC567DRAFT_92407 [Phyllosticta citribraziliensis]
MDVSKYLPAIARSEIADGAFLSPVACLGVLQGKRFKVFGQPFLGSQPHVPSTGKPPPALSGCFDLGEHRGPARKQTGPKIQEAVFLWRVVLTVSSQLRRCQVAHDDALRYPRAAVVLSCSDVCSIDFDLCEGHARYIEAFKLAAQLHLLQSCEANPNGHRLEVTRHGWHLEARLPIRLGIGP